MNNNHSQGMLQRKDAAEIDTVEREDSSITTLPGAYFQKHFKDELWLWIIFILLMAGCSLLLIYSN